MSRPSKKRLGLLQLIKDHGDSEGGQVYFPSFSQLELEDYGLCFWDKDIITYAEKAGLIKTKSNKTFAWLTDEGKQLLKQWHGGSDDD